MGKRVISTIAVLALVLLIWAPAQARPRLRVVARPAVRVVFPLPVVVYPVAVTTPVALVPSCPAGRYWSRRWQRCVPRCAPGYRWYPQCNRCLLIR